MTRPLCWPDGGSWRPLSCRTAEEGQGVWGKAQGRRSWQERGEIKEVHCVPKAVEFDKSYCSRVTFQKMLSWKVYCDFNPRRAHTPARAASSSYPSLSWQPVRFCSGPMAT